MKPVTNARRLPRETQPLKSQALNTRFIVLHGDQLEANTLDFVGKLLAGRSLRPQVIDASKLTAAQAVDKVAANLAREGHLLLCAHGDNLHDKVSGDADTHHLQLPDGDKSTIRTETLLRRVLDGLRIRPNRIDHPRRGLPFIYLFSCHSGALRKQIQPGSNLWRRAHLLIFSGTRQTTMLSSGNSVAGAIAYVDHCQQTLQAVDPLKLLFFAGLHRGDCITLMGGKLDAPLVWHAPKSDKDQRRIDNLSGSPEDLQHFKDAIGTLRASEYRLLPAASLTEVLCNRITRDDATHLVELINAHPTLRDAPSALGDLPLAFAAETQSSECLRLLLEVGADPNQPDKDGVVALMENVRYSTCKLSDLEMLLDHGAAPNCQDDRGRTALMFASREGHEEAIRILLEHGADPNIQESDGYTALVYAADIDSSTALRLLLAYRADPELQCTDGRTALMSACSKGHVDAVRILLEAGADPDRQDSDGDSGLILACGKGHAAVMQILLERGANPDLQDKHGLSALMYSVALTDLAPLDLLLAHGARMDLRAMDGRSCLGIAASDRRLGALKRLLAAGAGLAEGLDQALVERARQRNHLQAAAQLQQALEARADAQQAPG